MSLRNRITVKAYLVNGDIADIITDAKPKEAIDNYFYPDSGAPVKTLFIGFVDDKGKEYNRKRIFCKWHVPESNALKCFLLKEGRFSKS